MFQEFQNGQNPGTRPQTQTQTQNQTQTQTKIGELDHDEIFGSGFGRFAPAGLAQTQTQTQTQTKNGELDHDELFGSGFGRFAPPGVQRMWEAVAELDDEGVHDPKRVAERLAEVAKEVDRERKELRNVDLMSDFGK
jgi:hypothetical protein